MDIFRSYIWLTEQPLKRSLTIVLLAGLVVALIVPMLPQEIQLFVAGWVEEQLPFLTD